VTNAATIQRIREFLMPDVGEGLTEALIITWNVKVGDTVTDGQMICEIETAKAVVELPIPYDGTVRELFHPEGATVPVGEPIISIDTEAESAWGSATSPLAASPAPADPQLVAAVSLPSGQQSPSGTPLLVGYGPTPERLIRRPRRPRAEVSAEIPAGTASGSQLPLLAKPPVRKLARDLGVDLALVRPTGPGGRILREDVRAAAKRGTSAALPAEHQAELGSAALRSQPSESRVPIAGIRKATAAAMVSSAFTAPHVTEFLTVDITRTMRLVTELKQDPAYAGLRAGPLLIIAKALLTALKRHPDLNAAWDADRQEIVKKHYINLGIAAATPRGLIVPNIKDAHTMTLLELSKAFTELVTTARAGRTGPAALRNGTVTITNVGVFGVDTATPILNPGESAILAVGAIRWLPWVHKGKIKPRQVTTLALSFDHRLIDGELGSQALADLGTLLEQPRRLISWA
jgi:2-oxoisovalerate dehydrogenase E2 component (dihydrolipoyl transacylase)